MSTERLAATVALFLMCTTVRPAAHAQQTEKKARDSTLAVGLTAGESDGESRRRQLLSALKLDLGFTTLKIGGGVLVDYIGYDQDSASREQFHLVSTGKLRDARFLLGGRLLKVKRPVTWQAGIMYDAVTKKWFIRQTGFMIAVPEIWSHFFIGRAKEGFSLNKVMTGYDGWTNERQTFTDATVPLLADGIKWLGITPDRHWFWNLGLFTDAVSEGQTFSTYNNQFVLRAGWVPLSSDSTGTLVHIAMNFRAGDVNKDTMQLRSRPEAFEAPYFIDTGKFPAQTASAFGPEVYFRPGRVLLGTEFYWQKVTSAEMGNPLVHGGDIVVAWLTTGETRSYNTVGNYFRGVSPTKTVIEGGPGAWELVLRASYSTLTNKAIDGGTFWRVTSMLNWYLTDNVRLEFVHGTGRLKRFGIMGTTQFFQARIQTQL